MEAITYLNSFDMSTKNGQKLAKISQEKIIKLKNKYIDYLNKSVGPVQEEVKEKPVEIKESTIIKDGNSQTNVAVANNNYDDVVKHFSMGIYEKSFEQKPLAGARKIRVNAKVIKHVNGLSKKLGNGKLKDIVALNSNTVEVSALSNISDVNHINTEMKPATVTSTKVMQPNNVENSKSTPLNDYSSPSVDDYLQKERPNQENGLIEQLTGDVQSLKEEAVKSTAILEQLEAKYNALKSQKAQRIKELEEEKLSYTATLNGLTEKIKSLQDKIAQEEESLSSYKR